MYQRPDPVGARDDRVGFYRRGYNAAEYLIDTLVNRGQQHQQRADNNKETATGHGGEVQHDFEGFYAGSDLCKANVASVKTTILEDLINPVAETDGYSNTTGSGAALVSPIRVATAAEPNNSGNEKTSKFANGSLRELWVLLRYRGVSRVKHPMFITTRLGLHVLLAGLLSSFYYSQDYGRVTGMLNVAGLLFITVIVPFDVAHVFVEEMKFDREVYTREFNDAYYRAGNYVAGVRFVHQHNAFSHRTDDIIDPSLVEP